MPAVVIVDDTRMDTMPVYPAAGALELCIQMIQERNPLQSADRITRTWNLAAETETAIPGTGQSYIG